MNSWFRSRIPALVWSFGLAALGVFICLLWLTHDVAAVPPDKSVVPAPRATRLQLRIPAVYTYPLTATLDVCDTFGPRLLTAGVYSDYDFHLGVDWCAAESIPVHAVTTGTVDSFNSDCGPGIPSCYVHLSHAIADGQTRYEHLGAVHPAITNDIVVTPAQVIGWVGRDTGASSAYLHFETHDGMAVTRQAAIHPLDTPFLPWTNRVSPTVMLRGVYTDATGMTALVGVTSPYTEPDVITVSVSVSGTVTDNRIIDYVDLNANTTADELNNPLVRDVCIIPTDLNGTSGYSVTMAFRQLGYESPATVTAQALDVDGWGSTEMAELVGGLEIVPPDQSAWGRLGQSVTFVYTLTNRSGARDIFTLTHLSAQGWPAVVNPPTLDLADGQSGRIASRVTVSTDRPGPPDCGLLVATAARGSAQQVVAGFYRISRVVPPNGVKISGPSTGIVDTAYTFTATVAPGTTTPPITYHWKATDQTDIVTSTSILSHVVPFTWTTPGPKVITVTATNAGGTSTDTHTITISVPPSRVRINGPSTGIVNAVYTFTATVSPPAVTLPITYHWRATGQTDVVVSRNARTHAVPFTWSELGPQTITVTASNAGGTVSSTHSVAITAAEFPFYDGFESGALGAGWTVSTTAEGRVRVSHSYGPYSGTYHVLLDDAANNGTYSTAALILHVDLAGQVGVVLDFWWREYTDDDHPEDGVFISDDYGASWYRVVSFNGDYGSNHQHEVIYLDDEAAANGLTFNDHFQIKFQFHNNRPIPSNGYAIDNVWVRTGPIEDVVISGPTTGNIATMYTFTATVSPPEATVPITYHWQATGQTDVEVSRNARTHAVSFTWSTPGPKTITVTATNALSTATDSHIVNINIPPSGVGISGPSTGIINAAYTFTATVSPGAVTLPITYHWRATGQTDVVVSRNARTHAVPFTWSAPGTKVITVTATNAGGTVTDTHTVTINVPPSGVGISGPSAGIINGTYTFTATVSPAAVTLPITYHWQATGQTDVVVSRNARTHAVSFAWSTLGPQTITVTTSNAGGSVGSTHSVTITAAGFPFYDGFESGALGAGWTESTTVDGRVQVSNTYPHNGTYSVLLDDSVSDNQWSTAAIILNIDLAGQAGVVLDFWWRDFFDVDDPEDGVFISDDYGASWYQVLPFSGDVDSFQREVIYLDAEASAGGLTFNDHFQIKFQFYDRWPIPYNGYAVDDVWVKTVPIEGVEIGGPTMGNIDTLYAFTATVSPPTATLPITYTWSPPPAAGQGSAVAAYTWPDTGPKTINVTATNVSGSASGAHAITINAPPSGVEISGPSTGIISGTYTFNATVSPPAVTLPITYHWRATGQTDVVVSRNARTHAVSFAWSTLGPQTITLTVTNAAGTVSSIHAITITAARFPFYDGFESGALSAGWTVSTTAEGRVRVSSSDGPYSGMYHVLLDDAVDNGAYSTAALILHVDLAGQVGVVLDFWWREYGDEDHDEDGVFISDDYGTSWHQVVSFNGNYESDHQHEVIYLDNKAAAHGLAFNDHFQIKFQFYDDYPIPNDGYAIDNVWVRTVPVEGVEVSGPARGVIQVDYPFFAQASPVTAALPITYVWQATGQSPLIHTDRGLTDTASFNWGMTGTKTITVTASNVEGAAAHTHVITLGISPLTDLILSGPATSFAYVATPFTATVGPITATQPVTYIWRATDRPSPVVHGGGGLGDVISFTWRITGTKTVTVTAINVGGAITESRVITILTPVPPEGVTITGPTEGVVQFGHTFTARVSPISTTAPITYIWSATDNISQIHKSDLNDTVIFAWDTPGTKTITVTAMNPVGTVSDTHVITTRISPLIGVTVGGPTVGVIQTEYLFTATAIPVTASVPITYRWQATGQSDVVTSAKTVSHTMSYTWDTPGTKLITVSATNVGDTFTDTHVISIDFPLTGVDISGLAVGNVDVPNFFTALVSPITAALPITYHWRATEQNDVLVSADEPSHTVSFTWATPGTKAITVNATNTRDSVTGTHSITINIPLSRVDISGPTSGSIDTFYTFTATITPPTATAPIHYVWSPEPATGQGFAMVTYRWPAAGLQTIIVTATNGSSTASDVHAIAIGMPVESVTIEGPTSGNVGKTYAFSAVVSPTTASEPILYTWSPEPAMGQSSAVVEYVWSTTGPHTISVTTRNDGGTANDTHVITLDLHAAFLPMIALGWSPVPDLYPIVNLDGDGSYDVCWSSALATDYVLEEATNGAFTGATETYTTTDTCYAISGKRATRYYYRVAACGSRGCGPWSNVRSVDVRWEKEPDNNTPGGADGPLVSGVSYRGYPRSNAPDDPEYAASKNDYFWFKPSTQGQIRVFLTDFAGQPGWLLLYYKAPEGPSDRAEVGCYMPSGSNHCDLTYHGNDPPDAYYIRVYTENYNPVTPYTLRVTYP